MVTSHAIKGTIAILDLFPHCLSFITLQIVLILMVWPTESIEFWWSVLRICNFFPINALRFCLVSFLFVFIFLHFCLVSFFFIFVWFHFSSFLFGFRVSTWAMQVVQRGQRVGIHHTGRWNSWCFRSPGLNNFFKIEFA